MFGLGMSCNGNLTNASMAYLPYMPYNPFGITNFGGDIQIFPVNNYSQSQIGLAFNQVAQASGWPMGLFSGYQTSPQINMGAVIGQASSMAAQSLNQLASQEINTALQTIAGQKAKIQAQLQAKDLKDEDKAKLEAQLKKLEEYEAQIKALTTSGMDPQSAYLKANELKVAVNNLIAGKTEETTNQGTDNSSSPSSSSSSSSDSSNNDSGKTDPKTFIPWVDAMHDAIWGPGTDDEVFEAGLEEISKDDVVERMIQWNMAYPQESFMEAFMADADDGFFGMFGVNQKRKYGQHILRALRDKALELGIDLTKDDNYKKCLKEMDSWLYIDNGVADNYNALIQRLAKKMGYKYNYTPYSMSSK